MHTVPPSRPAQTSERPAWLHPDALPTELTNMLKVARSELNSIIGRLASYATLVAEPALSAYADTILTMDPPEAVQDVLDALSGYQELYDMLDHTGEFLQAFCKYLDRGHRAAKFMEWFDALPYIEMDEQRD